MANFTFSCPQCGQHLEAQDEWRGQQTQCPSCGTNIEIPKIMQVKPVSIDPQEQIKKLKRALYFFGGLAILCFLCWIDFWFTTGISGFSMLFIIPIILGTLMVIAVHKKIRELKSQIDQNEHLK